MAKVTREYLLEKGFGELGANENDIYYKIWFPKSIGISPKELSGYFSVNHNNSFSLNGMNSFGEFNFKECSKERLDEILNGIELINGKTIKELTGE